MNEMLNTFDLKGSKFQRKAVKDIAYGKLLQKAYEYDFNFKVAQYESGVSKMKTDLENSILDNKQK